VTTALIVNGLMQNRENISMYA